MPRLRFIVIAALSALALALPAAAVAAPTIGVTLTRPGANASQAIGQLSQAQALHMKVVRVDLEWSALEPRGAGQIDPTVLAQLDRLFAAASAGHIKVTVAMVSTPCWASSAPSSITKGCKAGATADEFASWPPRNPADFARIAAFVAGRYASRLEAFEVWNEPDQANQNYFAGPDKPRRYAAMLRAAYPALKAAAPKVPVLAGALVGSNGLFLKLLYQAGIKGYYDGLSVHYYDLVLTDLRQIHKVQLANGDHKPLWLGEFGWSSCAPQRLQAGQVCVSQKVQGQNLVDVIRSLRKTTWVKEAYIYSMTDTGQYSLGLIGTNGRPKPAFTAVAKQMARKSSPAPRSPVLHLRRSRGQTIAYGSGPAGDVLTMSVYQRATLRYKATFRLDANNQFLLRIPADLGTRGLRVRLYQQWQGSGHAVTERN